MREAVLAAGGLRALGRKLGIAWQAVQQWERCPPLRVLEVERLTGVSRHRLRPDIYPADGQYTSATGKRRSG